ncbi:MAG: hypothetical protein CL744_08420, partial [Chloroflexi bacterium]|nr:hypothetical protein [Chloroflexota bacterium]
LWMTFATPVLLRANREGVLLMSPSEILLDWQLSQPLAEAARLDRRIQRAAQQGQTAALLQAVTAEIEKRFYASGRRYHVDHSDESHFRIYRTTMTELLESYREECSLPDIDSFTLTEQKEFTYWLFKVRLKVSDKAKIASDTRKGLAFLQERSQERSRDLEDLSVLAS